MLACRSPFHDVRAERGPDERGDQRSELGDSLGDALGRHRPLDAVARGQVHDLQYAVHSPADRGAVAALRPGRQLDVASALGYARRHIVVSSRHGDRDAVSYTHLTLPTIYSV